MDFNELTLLTYTFGFLALLGIAGMFGEMAYKLAEKLGFGEWNKLSYKLDSLYKELETGKEINVKEYLCE